jgi:hypothetical protein
MKIELTVAYVAFGGNTGAGKYFYSYAPDVIKVTQANQALNFELSDATDDRFQVITLVSTDANKQFSLPALRNDGRAVEVMNQNSHPQLTQVSVLVLDQKTGAHISCDPQVLNVPDE